MRASARQRLALAGCAPALLGWAWLASEVPLKFDDLNYLTDALLHQGEPFFWVDHPWYTHWRPLAYLGWWALGPVSLDGLALRLLQVATWVGAAGLLAHLGWTRARWPGLLLAALALPLSPLALETLDWKSWLTSTGGILGLCAGLWELHREERARWWVVLLAGLVALGFKEIAAFTLGLAALLGGRGAVRAVGVALVAAGLAAAIPARHRLDPAWLSEGLGFYALQLRRLVWVLPLALASWRPEPSPWLMGLALGIALVGWWWWPLGAVLVLGSLAVLLRHRPAWGLAGAAAWAVSLAGHQRTPAYLLEGWLVLASILIIRPPRLRWWGWTGVVVLALLGLGPWVAQRPMALNQARAQRTFLREFHPEPAQALYPGPQRALDLDGLVWLTLGAEVQQRPPRGTRPGQLGPRSCVWADAVPLGPGERTEDFPPPGSCKPGQGFKLVPSR